MACFTIWQLYSVGIDRGIFWVKGWVGFRTRLEAIENREIPTIARNLNQILPSSSQLHNTALLGLTAY
jgi:hypothetical protein